LYCAEYEDRAAELQLQLDLRREQSALESATSRQKQARQGMLGFHTDAVPAELTSDL